MAADLTFDYFASETGNSLSRYQRNLDFIIQKYDKKFEEDDIVQLSSLTVVENKGCLKRSHLKCFGYTRLAATKKSDRSASNISSFSDLREQSNHLLNYSEQRYTGNQSHLTNADISAIPELNDPHDCDEPSDAETLGSDDSDSWDDLENSDSSEVYESYYSSSGEFSDMENSENLHGSSEEGQLLSDTSLVIVDEVSFSYKLDASIDVSNQVRTRRTSSRHHSCTKHERFWGFKSPNKERNSVADSKYAFSVENSKHNYFRKNGLRTTHEMDKASEVKDCNSTFTVSSRQQSCYKSLSDKCQNDDLTKPKRKKIPSKQCVIMAPEYKSNQIFVTENETVLLDVKQSHNAISEKFVPGMADGSCQNDRRIFRRKMDTPPAKNLNLPDLVLQADASVDLGNLPLPFHDETYTCRNSGHKSREDIHRTPNVNTLTHKNSGKLAKGKCSGFQQSSKQLESDHEEQSRKYLERKRSSNIYSTPTTMEQKDGRFSKQCQYDTQMMGINCQSPTKLNTSPIHSPRSCEVVRQSSDSIRKQLERLKMISQSTKSNGHENNDNSYQTSNINICDVQPQSPRVSNLFLSPKQQSVANSVQRYRSNIRTPSSLIRQLHIRSPHVDAGVFKSPQSRVQRQSKQIEICRPIAHSQVNDMYASVSNMPKSNTVERNIFSDACDRSHSVYHSAPVRVSKAAIDQTVITSNKIRTAWVPFNHDSSPAARNTTSTPNHKSSCKRRFETDVSTIPSEEIEAEILQSDATMILTNQMLSSMPISGCVNIQKNKLKTDISSESRSVKSTSSHLKDTHRKDCVVKPYDCETMALAGRLSKSKYISDKLGDDFESTFVVAEKNQAFKESTSKYINPVEVDKSTSKEALSKSLNTTFTVIEESDVKRKRSHVDMYPTSNSHMSNVYDISLDSDEELSISTSPKVDKKTSLTKLVTSMESKQNVSKLPSYKMDSVSVPVYRCISNHSSVKADKRKCRKRLDYMSASSADQEIKSAMPSRKRKRNRYTCPAKEVASKPETALNTSLSNTNPCLGPGRCSKSFCFTCMM